MSIYGSMCRFCMSSLVRCIYVFFLVLETKWRIQYIQAYIVDIYICAYKYRYLKGIGHVCEHATDVRSEDKQRNERTKQRRRLAHKQIHTHNTCIHITHMSSDARVHTAYSMYYYIWWHIRDRHRNAEQ